MDLVLRAIIKMDARMVVVIISGLMVLNMMVIGSIMQLKGTECIVGEMEEGMKVNGSKITSMVLVFIILWMAVGTPDIM